MTESLPPFPDDLVIASARNTYPVRFRPGALAAFSSARREHVIVDRAVAGLVRGRVDAPIVVDGGEDLKTLRGVEELCAQLLERGARRGDTLVAIGGGTVSDIVAFLAETFARGLAWRFLPTTLLAQADACVGGKSSINVARTKNVLGTVTPPTDVTIDVDVLRSLPDGAVASGLGEILKAHALVGPDAFDACAAALPELRAHGPTDPTRLTSWIRASLELKRGFVEADENDKGARRLLNLGHTFGHALEAALELAIPHGVAVAWGMQIANRLAVQLGLLPAAHEARMRPALFALAEAVPLVDGEWILRGIRADKKRHTARLHVIVLAGNAARAEEIEIADDLAFTDVLRAIIVRPWDSAP
jgi:3-dehydroquinate synthase